MQTNLIASSSQTSLNGVLSPFSGSRMESQEQLFGLARNRKRVFSEGESSITGVSRELLLFHDTLDSNNKTPTSNIQVSTILKLFDESWSWPSHFVRRKPSKPDKESSKIASRIATMKHYTLREETEEKLSGVSTKLTLFLDPWNIKKRLTHSDLGHLCRLLVQTTLVEKHILPFMNPHQMTQIVSKRGLPVLVWDQDTQSQHRLVLKKWSTCKSYVFIDGWSLEFVNRRDLQEGNEIGLYWDINYSRFNFRVLVRDQNI